MIDTTPEGSAEEAGTVESSAYELARAAGDRIVKWHVYVAKLAGQQGPWPPRPSSR